MKHITPFLQARAYSGTMRESDDNEKIRYFRTGNRFFYQNGSWWFSTREGEEGPFRSREQAEAGMARYVEAIRAMHAYKHKQAQKYKTDESRRPDPTVWDKQIDSL
ncbi:MAG: DUF6316 family protein [bacterium]